jgi:hypothetical protein
MSASKFAFSFIPTTDYQLPVMLENKQANMVLFGERNEYPYYLLDNYHKSAKHCAIVNGKVHYIVGKGWKASDKGTVEQQARAEEFIRDPNVEDDLNDLTEKLVLDLELFNGFALAVTWNRGGGIAFVEHVPFQKVRVSLDDEMFLIADWYDARMIQQFPKGNEVEKMPKFDEKNRVGKQMFYYRHYSAGVQHYPLPNYQGALAYIECDAEIARFHINNIRNQFWGGQLINFADGIPTEEEKDEIERMMRRKFSGAGNAGRFVLTFSSGKESAPSIQSLTPSDLDKQFDLLNKQIQEEIFVAHNVTNPMLFGVKTEGQLGGRKELIEAYELFKNTYVNARVQIVERMINYIAGFNDIEGLYLCPTDPVTEQLSEQVLVQIMTRNELREKAGLDPLEDEQVQPEGAPAVEALAAEPVNEALRTMTGRQFQHLMRIVRNFQSGKISEAQARTMLGSGFGLTAEQINDFLTDGQAEFSAQGEDAEMRMLAAIGAQYGDDAEAFDVVDQWELALEGDPETFAVDEEEEKLDKRIMAYRKKNRLATVKEIAEALKVSPAKIRKRIAYLLEKNRFPISRDIDIATKETPVEEEVVEVRYRYDWRPEYAGLSKADGYDKSRKFCQTMLDLSATKLYTRSDINDIGQLVGWNVWERRGGWFTLPNGNHRPSCRHMWVQQLVVKKGTTVKRVV